MDPLEFFWDNLLSRSPDRIRKVFSQLDDASQKKIIAHLKRMVSESGWHAEQVESARIALDVLADLHLKPSPSE